MKLSPTLQPLQRDEIRDTKYEEMDRVKAFDKIELLIVRSEVLAGRNFSPEY